MTDSPGSMLGHVALRVRLVYEQTAAEPAQATGTDIPGWNLVDLLPEDGAPDDAASAPDGGGVNLAAFRRRFATDPMELTLDRDEAEGYYLNLTSPEPSLFALIRLPDVASATAAEATSGVPEAEAITASYNEAARWMDGGMVVIRTALPEPLLAWIAEFAQHHFQVEGRKKGGKLRPSFLSRREFGEVAKTALGDAGQAAVSQHEKRH